MYVMCRSGFQPAGSGGRKSAEDVSRRYHEAGVADAEAMARKFEEAVKPRYQRAYDNYLADLKSLRLPAAPTMTKTFMTICAK